jgi:type IV pilus assembly protein PilC
MIESAEATGRLNESLERMAEDIESSMEITRKIQSALIYPVVIVVFVIGAMYGMLRFVIPQVSGLFATTGMELPAITRFLIASSDFVINNGFQVLITTIAIVAIFIVIIKTPPGRKALHSVILQLPVIGVFQKSIYQSRFARSMSNLLGAGVSVVDSAEITARSLKNVIYKKRVEMIAKDVSQGIPISESIQDSPYFSNLLVSMIAVGEKTAQIDELSAKIAVYYENKVKSTAENFAKLIQPFIIAVVGGMVGVVVLSIMLPMSELLGGIESL